MGQRLVILVQNNGMNLACAYYHWSAHTNDAMRLTSLAVTAYNYRFINQPSGFDAYHQAMDILVATGAGLQPEIRQNPEFKIYPEMVNHTNGIIFISPKTIKDCLDMCQGLVTIDIGTERIRFNVYDEHPKSDYTDRAWKRMLEAVDETIYMDILDITDIPIVCFRTLREFINLHPAGVVIDNGTTMPFIYLWI